MNIIIIIIIIITLTHSSMNNEIPPAPPALPYNDSLFESATFSTPLPANAPVSPTGSNRYQLSAED
jgi:hypothetical protein